mmetsp:Transcript_44679/g.110784  ORF Transcript_44679/g.110784 Transcript_44679/m.110784 type:complete len:270 (+) Transcript_44679:506-1315(+)
MLQRARRPLRLRRHLRRHLVHHPAVHLLALHLLALVEHVHAVLPPGELDAQRELGLALGPQVEQPALAQLIGALYLGRHIGLAHVEHALQHVRRRRPLPLLLGEPEQLELLHKAALLIRLEEREGYPLLALLRHELACNVGAHVRLDDDDVDLLQLHARHHTARLHAARERLDANGVLGGERCGQLVLVLVPCLQGRALEGHDAAHVRGEGLLRRPRVQMLELAIGRAAAVRLVVGLKVGHRPECVGERPSCYLRGAPGRAQLCKLPAL